uniref:Uncharacterized protein n=1 Tax=Arundo donax TaxID=35708 RepID=A0A0A9EKK9_ARUDO
MGTLHQMSHYHQINCYHPIANDTLKERHVGLKIIYDNNDFFVLKSTDI